jgi:hypothetical protein
MTLRHRLGALIYDWPRFLRHIGGDWTLIRNRDETITSDGRGVRCEWLYSSDLHIAGVYPSTGRMLMRRAFRDWPVGGGEAIPPVPDRQDCLSSTPEVSFLIGHRGTERLPNLLATLRSIAGQEGIGIECIVVEQSATREIEAQLPPWVRYIHTPVAADLDYCRAATFNAAARAARGSVLIAHDNDMPVPARYAAEVAARVAAGARFVDPKRFIFYLDEHGQLEKVVQNLKGGSVAFEKRAYFEVGGFDESFVGWGGEDLEFWERAREHGGVYEFGWLPLLHLWHAPQRGKVEQAAAPAQQRYFELRDIPAAERIARLRSVNFSNEK